MRSLFVFLVCSVHACVSFQYASAQSEFAPWGNISGIRIQGQLMEFETNLRVIHADGNVEVSKKEGQRPHFIRNGKNRTVTTTLGDIDFTETVTDESEGNATVVLNAKAKQEGFGDIVWSIALPSVNGSELKINNKKFISTQSPATLLTTYFNEPIKTITLKYLAHQVAITLDREVRCTLTREGNGYQLYIPLRTGKWTPNMTAEQKLQIAVSGKIDTTPITITLQPQITGRIFNGFGGNFRLQNSKTDPQVIDYCLENMRVAWGRVEMPWRLWQPRDTDNPTQNAKDGKMHPHVQRSMEMAQRLDTLGIPVILSAWSAPDWAIVGAAKFKPDENGVWGNPLNQDATEKIYKSIGDYIAYLKDVYGVEVALFSFNESDLGINIRQTGEEHAQLIKGLGKHLEARGLKTKMLLGDNSDATTYSFIDAALKDPSTHPYIGAVSFHSWRGWEDETLKKWTAASTFINRPLIVGEGSIDAQAWGYPNIFEESSYAIEEIKLYTRLLNICEPESILQWQLTADYSPLAGGGIFGDNSPLRPTQRFWNLKQLASTPPSLKTIAVQTDNPIVSVAALADPVKNIYCIHLVNTGPARIINIKHVPATVRLFKMVVTKDDTGILQGEDVPVKNGEARFKAAPGSYITLTTPQ